MIKLGSGVLAVLTLMIWGVVATAEPQTPVASDQEFLEFLGSWELEDGTWVNPLEFLGPDDDTISDDRMKEQSFFKKSDNDDHDKPTPTSDSTPQP